MKSITCFYGSPNKSLEELGKVMSLRTIALFSLMSVSALLLGGCGGGGGDGSSGTGYEITTWDNGKSTGTASADTYAVEGDSINYHVQGKPADENGSARGTWVVKHRGWKSAKSTQKYKATLYSGNQVVGTWLVRDFSTGDRSVLLYPADGSEVLRVCGNLVVQEINNGTAGDANHRVSVTDGTNTVYTKELSWYNRIGNYVQGQPADGSGMIYIWGNVKLEDLK